MIPSRLIPCLAVICIASNLHSAEMIDLSEQLAPVLQGSPVPCIGAAVIVNGQIIGYGTAGVRKQGDPTPVTRDDPFHIGSCGKAMTATLIGMLVDDGQLRWDMPLKEALRGTKIHPDLQTVTLRQLADHEGGLPHETPKSLMIAAYASSESEEKARAATVASILKEKPSPVGQFQYSNLGYATLGAIAEKVTGKTFADLMQERIFKPLGMSSAGFGAPGTAGKVDAPWGHRTSPVPPGPRADNPPAFSPAGRMHFSMLDWAKFIQFQLTGQPAGLIQAPTLSALHTVAHPGTTYSCGWGHTQRKWARGEALSHAGSNTMWFCIAWLAPKTQSAVIIACNDGNQAEAAKTCDTAAAMLIKKYLQ